MSDAARYRDSTQIVLPNDVVEELRTDLRREFTLTFVDGEGTRGTSTDRPGPEGDAGTVRIIGSPVEIKDASEWLTRHGVFVPESRADRPIRAAWYSDPWRGKQDNS